MTTDTRTRSLRRFVSRVASQLLTEHTDAWSIAARGLLSYQRAKRHGIWVILRTPSLGARRLVSARLLLQIPRTNSDWQALRAELRGRGLGQLWDAKFRYLYVPAKHLEAVTSRFNNAKTLRIRPLPADSAGKIQGTETKRRPTSR
jgi:hypothetical protein